MKREYVALFGSISLSERFADVGDESAQLFYVLLLAQCDSWGRITAKARTLGAMVWPLLGKSIEETQAAVDRLCAARMLERHALDGREWLQVPIEDWESKAGRLTPPAKRGNSEWPSPTEYSMQPARRETAPQSTPPVASERQSTPEHSGVLRSTPDDSGSVRSTLLREEERREEKSRGEPSPTPPRGRGDSVPTSAGQDLADAFERVEAAHGGVDPASEPPHAPPKRAKRVRIEPDAYLTRTLPPELDFPDVRAALVDFNRTRKGGPWDETLAEVRLRQIAEWGRVRAVAALRHSCGYEGVHEPHGAASSRGPTPSAGPKLNRFHRMLVDEQAKGAPETAREAQAC